ncbi:MAG: hypothetical protein ACUVWZ_06100 [Anaerolineae bacterium]
MNAPVARLIAWYRSAMRQHGEFLVILTLGVTFRLMAILVFRPGGYLGEMSDFGYYRLLLSFTNQGYYPVVHFWVEYPPLFPWIMTGLYRLSLWVPAWSEPGTWFFLLLSLFFAIVEAGNLVLFYAIARRLWSEPQAICLTWTYTGLLIPVLALFIGFDSLALFFLLGAVWWTLDRRPALSGIAAGLGFMTKLVPIVAAPSAVQHMRQGGQRLRYLFSLVFTLLLIAAPFLLLAPEYLWQSLKSPVVRSTWETVWALIDGYYSYGIAGGVDRFDPAMAGAAQHPTRLPWLFITLGFILFYLVLYTRRLDWTDRHRVVAFTALTQNLLTLYFKGYSPQFLVMLLPFMLLLIPGRRGVGYALGLSAINLIEYPIYFLVLPDQPWLLTGTVLLRTLFLVVVSVEYAGQIYRWRIPERAWNRLAALVITITLVLGVAGVVVGLDAYTQSRYMASPHRPAMETLIAEAVPGSSVVTDDLFLYEQLVPFLRKRFHFRLVETFDYLPSWEPRLAQVADQAQQVWVYASAGSPLHTWLARHYPSIARYEFDGWALSGWDTR